MTERVAADELKHDCERIEYIRAQKADLAEEEKEIFAAMKSRGDDVKAFKKVLARRKRDRDEVTNEDAMIEMIEDALGGA